MAEVDISALRMEEPVSRKTPRRPLGPRLALAALVVVVLGVAASFLVPLLTPARAVRTAPVRAAQREGEARAASAEAAGWIEPDPFPIVVRPLVDGVLESLLVLEGDEVKKGVTVIGRMRSAELQAARDRAATRLDAREADVKMAEAHLAVAVALLEQKGDLREEVARAQRLRSSLKGRLAVARSALAAAEAERDARRAELDGQEKLAATGGTYPVALARARAAFKAAVAAAEAKRSEVDALAAELGDAEVELAIAQELLADPRALAGKVAVDEADLERTRAERDAAKVELAIAERELGWAEIKAPADGVVMKLLAGPGEEVGPRGRGVVSIYDPARLQARVDVALASLPGVAVGQDVEVRSEVLGGRVTKGTVLRIQRESDLLKNTTQVKVRLIDPDPLLRPETLVRARFLAATGAAEGGGPLLYLVPRAALRGDAVFVVDPGGARRIPVERAGAAGDDVLVRGALSVTHRVILDEVQEGERVK